MELIDLTVALINFSDADMSTPTKKKSVTVWLHKQQIATNYHIDSNKLLLPQYLGPLLLKAVNDG